MMNNCEWLHRQLEILPIFKYPFNLDDLPNNGIYFFYEEEEYWRHGVKNPRIVRIGTHKGNNFRSRINDHFLFDERKMDFDEMKRAPKDRSIFRKSIGRVLLNRNKDDYLDIWNIDFTKRDNRESFGHLRDIDKEKKLEGEITDILRQNFSFRFIIIKDQVDRMGDKGLEKALIGTVSQCSCCGPSNSWFGIESPKRKIRDSGLWQVHYLNAAGVNDDQLQMIKSAIVNTKKWIER